MKGCESNPAECLGGAILIMAKQELDLEMERVSAEIKRQKAKLVCIQLPDGLKPSADSIRSEIESKTGSDVVIWLGSCYGACDVPLDVERLGVDLLVQFGHSEWKK